VSPLTPVALISFSPRGAEASHTANPKQKG